MNVSFTIVGMYSKNVDLPSTDPRFLRWGQKNVLFWWVMKLFNFYKLKIKLQSNKNRGEDYEWTQSESSKESREQSYG